MKVDFTKREIVSCSEFVKKFSEYSKALKDLKRLFIFKNNKPDMVVLDFDTYEEMASILEDIELLKIAKKREEESNGKIITQEELLRSLGINNEEINNELESTELKAKEINIGKSIV